MVAVPCDGMMHCGYFKYTF